MIHFKCQHCGASINVPEQYAGKKGKCPSCKQLVEVPSAVAKDSGLVPMKQESPARKTPPAKQPAAVTARPPAGKQPAQPAAAPKPAPAKPKRPAPPEDDVEVAEVVEEVEVVEAIEEQVTAKKPRPRAAEQEADDVEVVEDDEPPKARKRPGKEEKEPPHKGRKQPASDEDEVEAEVAEVEEEDEEDQPRRRGKKGKRKAEGWAECPNCGAAGDAKKVKYTWWGGVLAPKMFAIVRCNQCGTSYNGRSGKYCTVGMIIYLSVGILLVAAIFGLAAGIYLWRKGEGQFGQVEPAPRQTVAMREKAAFDPLPFAHLSQEKGGETLQSHCPPATCCLHSGIDNLPARVS